jgi:meso-butanediol dehydrogenase / (S,S)-butanediol dehydrogenase / diacetyl reductase
LTERVALVTGAGSGLGEGIARVLADQGFRVAVTDIDEQAARRVAESIVSPAFRLDVTDAASVAAAADAAEAELGPIDTWISNAGVSTMSPFLETSDEDWDFNLTVNAKGVFLCGREAARRMVARESPGVIVNTASLASKRGAVPYLSAYVASKCAVLGLTQAMAVELAPHGIRVNCICPSYVPTSMQDRELAWEAKLADTTPDEVRAMYLADTPLGYLPGIGEFADAVAFLVSDQARFITGEALAVNGGAYMD